MDEKIARILTGDYNNNFLDGREFSQHDNFSNRYWLLPPDSKEVVKEKVVHYDLNAAQGCVLCAVANHGHCDWQGISAGEWVAPAREYLLNIKVLKKVKRGMESSLVFPAMAPALEVRLHKAIQERAANDKNLPILFGWQTKKQLSEWPLLDRRLHAVISDIALNEGRRASKDDFDRVERLYSAELGGQKVKL